MNYVFTDDIYVSCFAKACVRYARQALRQEKYESSVNVYELLIIAVRLWIRLNTDPKIACT